MVPAPWTTAGRGEIRTCCRRVELWVRWNLFLLWKLSWFFTVKRILHFCTVHNCRILRNFVVCLAFVQHNYSSDHFKDVLYANNLSFQDCWMISGQVWAVVCDKGMNLWHFSWGKEFGKIGDAGISYIRYNTWYSVTWIHCVFEYSACLRLLLLRNTISSMCSSILLSQ